MSDTRIYEKYVKSLRQDREVKFIGSNVPDFWRERDVVVLSNILAIFRYLVFNKRGIVHFHDPDFLPFALILRVLTRHKIVYDVHEDYPKDMLVKTWLPKWKRLVFSLGVSVLERLFMQFGHGVVSATDIIAAKFNGLGKFSITVKNYPIVNPLELGDCALNRAGYCYIGSISENRGIKELLNIALDCDGLVLAGSFTDTNLEESIRKSEGWLKLDYRGYVDANERDLIMNNSAVGLLMIKEIPTFEEALPVKLFEYMERGLPVLCSNLKVAAKIVRENNCGIVCDFNDHNNIINALQKLLEDTNSSIEMGLNGRRAVIREYSWENEYNKLIRFYSDLCVG